ncbi:CHASE2 domain-containing protein [Duganella sp. FT94W]|uniref:CHASE2 domain-containing protein n=1 Tax=Duganella lactea TaxID=2692173 RepID=A0ABW9VBL2_9BURK|nr:CHASE2 domain-containing protein [Duganella lactea]
MALLVGLLLTFLLEWAFGEEFVTRQQARAYAPFAGSVYGEGRRDDIRVLLIDDKALASAKQQWPARYGYSARLLRALAEYRPKAVFVDIYYGAQRDDDSLPALLRQVCALREQGTQVFLAASRNREDEYVLRPELEALAGKCFEKVAVKYSPDELDRLAWNYTLALPGAHHSEHGEHGMKSAALALYETGGATAPVEHHPMALTWGSRPAAHGVGWAISPGSDESYCRQPHNLPVELLPPGARNTFFKDGNKPLCVFHETIHAGTLSSTTPEQDAVLRQQIEGKIVLIGTALSDFSDVVLSPLHGRIPGVYLHAMALDNLMVFGEDYARAVHLSLDWHNLKLPLFLAVSMLLVTLPLQRFKHAVERRLEPDGQRVHFWLGVLYLLWGPARIILSLLVGCLLLLIGQYWLDLGFLSIINVVVLTLLAEWFEVNEKLGKYFWPKLLEEGEKHVSH